MRRVVAVVASGVLLASCTGSVDQADDLLFQLAPVTEVVEVAPGSVLPLGSALGILNEEVLLYSFPAEEADLVEDSELSGAVRFLRDPLFVRDFDVLTRDADRVVMFLRPVPVPPEATVTVEGLVVAITSAGTIVRSDFEETPMDAQLAVLFAALDRSRRVEHLTEIIEAIRDDELGEPIEDPALAALVEEIRAAG